MSRTLLALAGAFALAGCGPTTTTTSSTSTSTSTTGTHLATGAAGGASGNPTSTTSGTTSATNASTTSSSGGTSTSTNGPATTSTSGSPTGGTSSTTSASASTSTSTSGGGTTSTSSSSSSSGGTTACVPSATIADIRALPPYSPACINNVTVVYSSPYGNAKPDGGTQYPGNWYIADSTGAVLSVYKSSHVGILSDDPSEKDVVNVSGLFEVYPLDAGGIQQIAGANLQFTLVSSGSGTLPTPMSASFSDLDEQNGNPALIGQYVTVPGGSYSEDPTAPEFTYTSSSSGKTYHDGISLSDGTSTVLVDTFTFDFSTGNCLPRDGGQPDLSSGGFNGIFDVEETDDHVVHKVIFYAQCGH